MAWWDPKPVNKPFISSFFQFFGALQISGGEEEKFSKAAD